MSGQIRIKIAIVLFLVSYVSGWPLLIGIEALAAYYESTFIAALGPVVYVISWIPWIVAFLIGGPPALKLAKEYIRRIFSRRNVGSNHDA
jgi:hypothetical protein